MLYLTHSLSLIPSGTECRIFGQWSDGRTLIQTREPLTVDGIEATDGMQPNGIDIGITEETPVAWEIYQPEAPAATVKEQAKTILEPLKPLAYQDPNAVREAIGELFTPEEQRGVIGTEVTP